MNYLGIPILLAIVVATPAVADTNFNFGIGIRDESGSEDRLPALSVAADFGPAKWIVRPEVGFAAGFDPLYGGTETEISAGIVHYWNRPKLRVHLGGGFVDISTAHLYDRHSDGGMYAHTGVSWPVRGKLRLGLDLRSLWADDFEVGDAEISVGYLQISFLMGWRF